MNNLITRYKDFSGKRSGDYAYYVWKFSKCAELGPSMIPMQFPRVNQTIASKYSDQGLRYFYPWFLSDNNSSENIGYLQVVTEILSKLKEISDTKKYTLIRGDVNIFMPWIRVSSLPLYVFTIYQHFFF